MCLCRSDDRLLSAFPSLGRLEFWLASGAEVGTTIADGDALEGGAAAGAGLAAAMGNLEIKMGGPQFPAGAVVVDNAGPLTGDGRP